MGEVHRLIDQHGRENALRMVKGKRASDIVRTACDTMSDEHAGVVANLIYSGWTYANLPHRRLANDAKWQIQTDYVTLVVEPGFIVNSDGSYTYLGCPFGPTARLILIYLQTRALETGERTVELGSSLRGFLGRLGISHGGKTQRTVRDQIMRISHCKLTFQLRKDGVRGVSNQAIVDTAMFWEADQVNDRQGSLFQDRLKLSEGFYQQLRRHAVKLDEAAVRKIHKNSRALDAYSWLAFRLHNIQEPTFITWAALRPQFGQGISTDVEFRRTFADDLRLAQSVYPDADLDILPKGVFLRSSPPPIMEKPRHLTLITD